MATSAAAGGLARRHLGGRCRGGPAADRDRVRQRRGALSRPVHARLDVASQRRDRGGRRAAGHRRSELPAEPGRARQGRRPDRSPLIGHCAKGKVAKLDINTATREQLLKIPAIDAALVDAIIAYRQDFGGFLALTELKSAMGLDTNTYKELAKSLTVN